jgi:uncharacterized membrane protein
VRSREIRVYQSYKLGFIAGLKPLCQALFALMPHFLDLNFPQHG